MIAFEKKNPLLYKFLPLQWRLHLWRNIPRHRCLVFSNLHLHWVCIMLKVWSISYRISMISFLLYQLYQQFCFEYVDPYTVTGMESELFLSLSFSLLSLLVSVVVMIIIIIIIVVVPIIIIVIILIIIIIIIVLLLLLSLLSLLSLLLLSLLLLSLLLLSSLLSLLSLLLL